MSDQPPPQPEPRSAFGCPQCRTPVSAGDILRLNPGQLVDGTGLGLALVKRIVEAHDSRIEVENEPGRGSVFALELPIAPLHQTG